MQGEPSGDLEDVLLNVKSLESELGRLDRKITNRIQGIQTKFEETNRQIRSVEEGIKDLQTQIYKLDEKVDYIKEN